MAIFRDEVDSADLIGFAEVWKDLGGAIQSQVIRVLDQGENADVNMNAILAARDELVDFHEDFYILEEWLMANTDEGDL